MWDGLLLIWLLVTLTLLLASDFKTDAERVDRLLIEEHGEIVNSVSKNLRLSFICLGFVIGSLIWPISVLYCLVIYITSD